MAADEQPPAGPVTFAGAIPADASEADFRRWLRDIGALLALPALWVDREPHEIASGLLSVLFGVLRLDSAYVRFDDPHGASPLETWRPSGPAAPAELLGLGPAAPETSPGMVSWGVEARGGRALRITRFPIALPWESGSVVVSARRPGFPTTMETQVLRFAVSQAAIAIHTARRLTREHVARSAAEDALRRQNQLLRSLVEDIEPSLTSISQRVHEASLPASDAASPTADRVPFEDVARPPSPGRTEDAGGAPPPHPLTRREREVLGLLAQGLSNKEIGGVLWLSDRTVERHITSLYRKIGVARRSEATAFALRNGVD